MKTVITTLILLFAMQGIAQTTIDLDKMMGSEQFIQKDTIYKDGRQELVTIQTVSTYPKELNADEAKQYLNGVAVIKEVEERKGYANIPFVIKYEVIKKLMHITEGEEVLDKYSKKRGDVIIICMIMLFITHGGIWVAAMKESVITNIFNSMAIMRCFEGLVLALIVLSLPAGFGYGELISAMMGLAMLTGLIGIIALKDSKTFFAKGYIIALVLAIFVTAATIQTGAGNWGFSIVNRNWIIAIFASTWILAALAIEMRIWYQRKGLKFLPPINQKA